MWPNPQETAGLVTFTEEILNGKLNFFAVTWISFDLYTAKKLKFFIKDFFSKCDQIRRKVRVWSHLLKKSLMENFIFCSVIVQFKSIFYFLPKVSSILQKLLENSAKHLNKVDLSLSWFHWLELKICLKLLKERKAKWTHCLSFIFLLILQLIRWQKLWLQSDQYFPSKNI